MGRFFFRTAEKPITSIRHPHAPHKLHLGGNVLTALISRICPQMPIRSFTPPNNLIRARLAISNQPAVKSFVGICQIEYMPG